MAHLRLVTDTTTADVERATTQQAGADADLPQVALRMLADLTACQTCPEAGEPYHVPRHVGYGVITDTRHRRIQVLVFGFTDREIYTGPDHVPGMAPDMPEILGAAAMSYGGGPEVAPPRRFDLVVTVLDEDQQRAWRDRRDTATRGHVHLDAADQSTIVTIHTGQTPRFEE